MTDEQAFRILGAASRARAEFPQITADSALLFGSASMI